MSDICGYCSEHTLAHKGMPQKHNLTVEFHNEKQLEVIINGCYTQVGMAQPQILVVEVTLEVTDMKKFL
jgi:hypothetical protein